MLAPISAVWFGPKTLFFFHFVPLLRSTSGIKKWDGGTGMQHAENAMAFMQKTKKKSISLQQHKHASYASMQGQQKGRGKNIVVKIGASRRPSFRLEDMSFQSTSFSSFDCCTIVWGHGHPMGCAPPLMHACWLFFSLASCVFSSQSQRQGYREGCNNRETDRDQSAIVNWTVNFYVHGAKENWARCICPSSWRSSTENSLSFSIALWTIMNHYEPNNALVVLAYNKRNRKGCSCELNCSDTSHFCFLSFSIGRHANTKKYARATLAWSGF